MFIATIGVNSNVSMKTRYTYAKDVIEMEMKLKWPDSIKRKISIAGIASRKMLGRDTL